MGKNGVTVNGILHTPSSAPQQLYTQDFLQVGEQKFFFLLPKGTSRSVLLLHSGDHQNLFQSLWHLPLNPQLSAMAFCGLHLQPLCSITNVRLHASVCLGLP